MMPWVSYANETLSEESTPPTETGTSQEESVPETPVDPDTEENTSEETPLLDEILNPEFMGFSMFSSLSIPSGPDLSGYQYLALASGSQCALINSGTNVVPTVTPSSTTYGYYMNIYNRGTATSSNYIYYGGATNTPIDSCADTVNFTLPLNLWTIVITNGATFDLKPKVLWVTINLWTFTARKVGTPPSCKYVLESNSMSVWTFNANKSACEAIWKRNPLPSNRWTCSIDAPLGTLTQNNYSPNPFNINTAILPGIESTNASGYDVKFYPLNLDSLTLPLIQWMNIPTGTWNPVASLTIPTEVQLLLSTFTSTSLTCGINAELPTQVQSCNLSQIPQLLSDITTALSSSAFTDIGQSVLSLGEVGVKITALLAGLQNGGVDPADLEDIQASLQGLQLPDFTATATSFDQLADAFEAASSCTALLGVDTHAVVAELRATAQALRDVDSAFETIKDSLETLSQPNQQPSAYIRALANLSDAIANAVEALDNLRTSWDNLSDLIDTLSIPGIGNIGGLGDILWGVSDVLSGIVDAIDDVVDPLHDASDILEKIANLAEAIENNDTDAIIDALDELGNTDFFNNAQARTIATIAAIEDITNAIEHIYALPLPQLGNDVSCTTLGTYQTQMIAYLDNQIAWYVQLKVTVQSFQAATNLNVSDLLQSIDAIIAKLQHVKTQYSSVNIGAECEGAQAAFEDAKADLEQVVTDAKDLIEDLKDEIKDRLAHIEFTLDQAIEGIHNILEDALDSIPGLTEAVKERIIDHLEAIKDRIIDKLKSFTESTIVFLEANKLAAPTFGGLVCEAQQVTTTNTATFTMQDHNKPEEVLWYVAIVDGPNGEEVYVLAWNEKEDFVLPTPVKGEYNVTFRTIGKDALIHSTPFFNFIAELDLTQNWTVLKGQLKAHIQSSVSQLPTPVKFVLGQMIDHLPQQQLTALLSALQAKTAHFTQTLQYIQAKINSLNETVGVWTKVTWDEHISVESVIEAFAKADALAAQYSLDNSLKGRFITSLFNPTSHYSALAVSEPEAWNQTVYAIAGEETTIYLQGSDDDSQVVFTIDEERVSPEFTDTFTQNTTIEYTVTKYVGNCEYPISTNGTVNIIVIPRPSVQNITIGGFVNTAFSRELTATGLTGTSTYYLTGPVGTLSGTIYAGTLPSVAGTYTWSYRVCNVVEGFEWSICSDTASITLTATARQNEWGGGWGWGGGSAGGFVPPSLLDTGWPGTGSNSTGTTTTWTVQEPTDNGCSIQDSPYSTEENNAYLYGCNNDMTTIRSIKDARLYDKITRAELAKMISQYAVNALGMTPDTTKDCSLFAKSIAHSDPSLQTYMVMSCQLNIMGIEPDKSPLVDFMPDKYVTRAEFGTVISRLLRWDKYENNDVDGWYKNHLEALKASGIISNTNPTALELRAWILLILHRTTTRTNK